MPELPVWSQALENIGEPVNNSPALYVKPTRVIFKETWLDDQRLDDEDQASDFEPSPSIASTSKSKKLSKGQKNGSIKD